MKDRIKYLDVLRIVAAAMVVMIHVSGWPSASGICEEVFWDGALFGALSSCAVPVFFMISGSLMLSPQYEFSTAKIFRKIAKLILIWIIWNALYALVGMDHFSFKTLVVRTVKGHFHFWFFEYLASMYLLMPVLRALTEYEDGKYVEYFLICWFVLGILKSTLSSIPWHSEEIRVITGKFHFELCDFSGYFVLGHYLSLRRSKINRFCWAVGFIIFGIAQYLVRCYYPLSVGTYSFTALVVLEAVCLFMLCKGPETNCSHSGRFIRHMATCTLGVYILHPLILGYLLPESMFGMPPVARILIPYLYVLGVATCFSFLLNSVPFTRKWIMNI